MFILSPRRFITGFMATTIAASMLWPINVPQSVPTGADKLVHFTAFMLLVLPGAFSRRMPAWLLFGRIFIGAATFGGIIEVIQPHFGRTTDFNDWVADMAGAALGLLLALIIRRIHFGRKLSPRLRRGLFRYKSGL